LVAEVQFVPQLGIANALDAKSSGSTHAAAKARILMDVRMM
jgi:hypothetical protein